MEYDPKLILDNVRANLNRDLPEVVTCKPHNHIMTIVGGGPSLADTKDHLGGYICAINGSLRYLLENGITPNACGIVDPHEHIADMIDPHPYIHYYVASMAHPSVFEKLKDCHVIMWHASGPEDVEELLMEERPDDWFMIGGGSTMGVRWLNLGYVCGFRKFNIHGMDSSYRDGQTHAYPERERKQRITADGWETSPNFLRQVADFSDTLDMFAKIEPTTIEVHGDGLLPGWYEENVK